MEKPLNELLELIVDLREDFRKAKEYKIADDLREYLKKRNVEIVDGKYVRYN
jgi:cysteinyl-tRNA synthetase